MKRTVPMVKAWYIGMGDPVDVVVVVVGLVVVFAGGEVSEATAAKG